jgi:hypothetical protein
MMELVMDMEMVAKAAFSVALMPLGSVFLFAIHQLFFLIAGFQLPIALQKHTPNV